MSVDRIPMSKDGYEKLKAQLDTMKNEEMPRIAEQIAAARDFGDLSENAEFDAAARPRGCSRPGSTTSRTSSPGP